MGLLNNFIKILKKGELEQAKIQKNKLPQDDVTIGTSGITFKATDDKSIEALNQALKEEGYRGPGLNLSRIGEVLSEKMGQGMRTLDMEELLLAIQKDNEELFNFLKRDTQTLESVVATAQGMGLQKIADTLLRRNPGEVLSVEHLVGGVIAVKLVKKVRQVIRFLKSSLVIVKNALRVARTLLRFGPKALGKVGKVLNIGTKTASKVTKKTTQKVATKVAKKGGFKALGMIPIIGNLVDVAMAGYRASKGDFTGAALSLGSAIPGPIGYTIAAADIARDVVSPSEERPKGTLGTIADTYSDLVNTTTNMNFSRNVKSQNLQQSTRNNVTIMDTIKVSDMVNNQGTANSNVGGDSENSIPFVGAEDVSNSYIPLTKDLLGVYD